MDLLIRTGGKRISNFLLWQCAYAEFAFSGCLAEYNREELWDDILAYTGQSVLWRRNRKVAGSSRLFVDRNAARSLSVLRLRFRRALVPQTVGK